MKLFIAFFSLIGSLQATDFSQHDKPATVKVLLQQETPEVTIEVRGRHYIYNPLDGTQVDFGIVDKKCSATAEEYGIKWGEKFSGYHQLRFVPGDSRSKILVDGIQYKGCVELYQNDATLHVINEIDTENYLKSVLSAKFQHPPHEEVMNALAIVERTMAYFLAQKGSTSLWHVTAEESNYQGVAMLTHPHVAKAVETTRHAVLTLEGAPFAAMWTENSAGRTVDLATIFRKAIRTPPGVDAPLAAKERHKHQWSYSLPKQLLAEATEVENVTGIDLYVTGGTEKVYGVKVTGKGETKDFTFPIFQEIVGKNKLRSNDFTVEMKGSDVVFTGFGQGIGVGLCLYSAEALATKGEKAPQILQMFFPGTKIEKIKSW